MADGGWSLAESVATQLEQRADELLQFSCDANGAQPIRPEPTRAAAPLPDLELLPAVLKAAAGVVRAPDFALGMAVRAPLDEYTRRRRDQGCSLGQLLDEVETIVRQVESSLGKAVLVQSREWPMQDTMAVFGPLAGFLRQITVEAVDAYRNIDRVRCRSLLDEVVGLQRAVAHEMRSKLQAATLATTFLGDDEMNADPQLRIESFDLIQTAVNEATDLLDDLQLCSAAGLTGNAGETQELVELFASVRREISRAAEKRGVEVEFLDAPEGMAVEGSAAQLLLVNLIRNRLKCSDPARDKRWLRLNVRLIAVGGARFARFEVSDNGRKSTAEQLGKSGRPGFRTHAEADDDGVFSMTIGRALVEERGGAVEILCRPGEGDLHCFSLPATSCRSGTDQAEEPRRSSGIDRTACSESDPEPGTVTREP